MQIDFHHGATYALARIAGLSHAEADTIAYAAQYVDDATNAGIIRFNDRSSYERISSAHKALDYRNFTALAVSRVWIPFHFMPGNCGHAADEPVYATRPERLITLPDSHPARDMVRMAILAKDRPWGVHRFGITMHVFADTWAHQGFVGVNHEVNDATDIRGPDGRPALSLIERMAGYFVSSAVNPLGHGAVLSFPDRPWLRWSYVDGLGRRVERDNPRDYLQASDRMCQVLSQFAMGDPDATAFGLPDADRAVFEEMIAIDDEDGERRHALWLEAIARGRFSFGPADVTYIAKGEGSWKHRALDTAEAVDQGDEVFPMSAHFANSDWKLFHDALQEHRFDILHRVLPKYGILTA
jgi:hypothetical protein